MDNCCSFLELVLHSILPMQLVYSKYDEAGFVLFETKETKNDLTLEVGGYEHVPVLQNIRVIDSDLGKVLHELPKGNVPGDFLDAIVVGMDLLIKKYAQTNKGKKRLCLITNGLSQSRILLRELKKTKPAPLQNK